MQDGRSRLTAAIEAVAEVGNPTIVATLTVIAALLPMLFVSGMGPYMAPIPVNASAAMLFSFFVAVAIAPWLMLKLAPRGVFGLVSSTLLTVLVIPAIYIVLRDDGRLLNGEPGQSETRQ